MNTPDLTPSTRLHLSLRIILLLSIGLLACATRAADPPANKITYDDHVRPIFRQYCLKCHDAATKRSDLALDAYATTMEGGASGEVVYASDLDSSRLWLMVNHEDEPAMPPGADKLPEDKLTLVRGWIEGGALENSGSVAQAKKPSGLAMRAPAVSGKPAGPAAMPESIFRQPVVATRRAAAITALAASPWAPLVAVAGQHQVALYHSESAQLLGVLPFLEGTPHVLKFSRDGSLLLIAGGRGAAIGLATLVDVRSGSRLVTVGDEYDAVLAADVSPNQALIALGSPAKVIRVYRTAAGTLAYEIRKHTDWITAIAFSPDGQWLVTADRSGGAYLWEAATGREVATLRGHKSEVTAACWRADSQLVATSGLDGTVRLWNRAEGKQVKSWTAHAGGTSAVDFAADGRLVSTGRDRLVKWWKPDGGHLENLTTFGDIGLQACITHDGKRVVAGDYTGAVRLLEVESGKQVGLLAANPPTLAMRTATATAQLANATGKLKAATAAKQSIDKRLEETTAEAQRRSATLATAKRQQAAAHVAQDAAGKEVALRLQAIRAIAAKVKQTTGFLAQAASALQTAEAALAGAKDDSLPQATDSFTQATAAAKKAISGIEATRILLQQTLAAHTAAQKELTARREAVQAAQQSVQKAQTAVDQFSKSLADATQEVAKAGREVAARQEAVAAAQKALTAAQAEQAVFSQASATLSAAIQAATAKAESKAKLVVEAKVLAEKLAAELATRQAAAQTAEKQLAEARKRAEQIEAAVETTVATVEEQAHATSQLMAAERQATAAAAQAQADAELFKKTAEARATYQQ